jgi:hypothetical protein
MKPSRQIETFNQNSAHITFRRAPIRTSKDSGRTALASTQPMYLTEVTTCTSGRASVSVLQPDVLTASSADIPMRTNFSFQSLSLFHKRHLPEASLDPSVYAKVRGPYRIRDLSEADNGSPITSAAQRQAGAEAVARALAAELCP